jgi:hypothetical protein
VNEFSRLRKRRYSEILLPNISNSHISDTESFIECFKESSSNLGDDLVAIMEHVTIKLEYSVKCGVITSEDVCGIVCNEITLSFFDVYTFWVMHLYDILKFEKYIEFAEMNGSLMQIERFLRSSLEADISESNHQTLILTNGSTTEYDSIVLALLADILRYLYRLSSLPATNQNTALSTLATNLILSVIAPKPEGCFANEQQISRRYYSKKSLSMVVDVLSLFSDESNGEGTSTSRLYHDFLVDLFSISYIESLPSDQSLVNREFLNLVACFHPSQFISCLDEMVKGSSSQRSCSFDEVIALSAKSTYFRALDLFLEYSYLAYTMSRIDSRTFRHAHDDATVNDFHLIAAAFTANTSVCIDTTICSFLEDILMDCSRSVCTALHIRETAILLRAYRIVDLITSNAIKVCKYTSLMDHRASVNILLCRWLELVYKSIASSENCIDNHAVKAILAYDLSKSTSIDTAATISSSKVGNLTLQSHAAFQFLLLSLHECIHEQTLTNLRALNSFCRQKRSLDRELVDSLTQSIAKALDASSDLDSATEIEGAYPSSNSTENGVELNGRVNSSKKSIPQALIPADRIGSWLQSFRSNCVVPAGLNCTCSIQGYKLILQSFEAYLEAYPKDRQVCMEMVMALTQPPNRYLNLKAAQSFCSSVNLKSSKASSAREIFQKMRSKLNIPKLALAEFSLDENLEDIVVWFVELDAIVAKGQVLSAQMQIDALRFFQEHLASLLQAAQYQLRAYEDARLQCITMITAFLVKMVFKVCVDIVTVYSRYNVVVGLEASSSSMDNNMARIFAHNWYGFLNTLCAHELSRNSAYEAAVATMLTKKLNVCHPPQALGNEDVPAAALLLASSPSKVS